MLDLLRTLRAEAGLTQAQLARRLGRHRSYVSRYERGVHQLDIIELRELCGALGLGLGGVVRRIERSISSAGPSRR